MGRKIDIAILTERVKQHEKQRKIQAKEYARRLKDLNGEAGRLRAMQTEYIPREVFDRTINEVNGKIDVNTNYIKGQEGKSVLSKNIPWVITTVIAIIALILMYIKSK